MNALLLTFTGALMLWFSWGKWMDTWIDFGDDLFIQWKIVNGAVLYRDIAYFRGPFPLYFNAALFKLFGTGILTLVVAQVLMIALVTVLTYRFFQEISGTITAFVTSFVFLTMFTFSQYIWMGNFNFVCPYTYAIVDGYVLSMLGIYSFYRFIKNKNIALLFWIGIITGFIFLIKVEITIAFCLTIAEGMILWNQFLRKPGQISLIKGSLIMLAGAIVPLAAFWIYFSQHMPWGQAFHSLVLQYLPNENVTNDTFYLHTSGLDNSSYNIMQMFDKASVYCMAVVLIAAFVYITYQLKEKPYFGKLRIFFIIFVGFVLWRVFDNGVITAIFRPLPLILLLFGIFIKWGLAKGKAVTPQMVGLAVFLCFALLMLFKIYFDANISGYGFILALPAVLVLVVIMLEFLPKMIDGLFKGSEDLVCSISFLLIGVVVLFYVNQSKIYYSARDFEITHGRDQIISFNPQVSGYSLQFQEALNFVNTHLGPRETFLVLPEGTLLNYLTRRDTGTHYFKLGPAEEDLWEQDAVLRDFRQHPPDYIFYKLWRGFGRKSYSYKIFSWIRANYRQVDVVKTPDQTYMVIVKRI